MVIVIAIMLAGIITGYVLRSQKITWIGRMITLCIWLLLFFLGTEVGNNKDIIKGFYTLGLDAVVISLAGLLGSLTCAKLLWMWINKGRGKA